MCRTVSHKSEEELTERVRRWAEKGKAWAQCILGQRYCNGVGVEQSYQQAKELFELAASQGDADAQYNLGIMHAEGLGVDHQSYERAAEYYEAAARQGLASAQSNLGVLYVTGQGIEQSIETGREWMIKAAEQGHKNAIKVLQALDEQEGRTTPSFTPPKRCLTCDTPESPTHKLRNCKCKGAQYCNTKCQAAHWKSHQKEHRRLCKEMKLKKTEEEERRRKLGFNVENPWSQEKEEELRKEQEEEERRRKLGFNEESPWSQEKEDELMREQEEEERRRRNLGFNVFNPWSQEKEDELMREQEEEERRNLGFNVCNPWSQEKENKLKDELNSGGSGFSRRFGSSQGGFGASFPAAASGFSFGSEAIPAGGFSFGSEAIPASGFSFSSGAASSASGFTFGSGASSATPAAAPEENGFEMSGEMKDGVLVEDEGETKETASADLPKAQQQEEGDVFNPWKEEAPKPFECATCFRPHDPPEHKLRPCNGCHRVFYCSKECQVKHWKRERNGHKKQCNSEKENRKIKKIKKIKT